MALFWTFCVFVVVLYLQNINCFEPKCSSYDYDKQLLERMIEREYEFRAVRDEIKQANDNVKQGLDEMKEDKKLIKQELENIKEDRKLVKEELSESKDTLASKLDEVFNQQQAVISRMSEDLQKMGNKTLQEIKATIKSTVSFRTSATNAFTLSNTPIIFQSVDFNIGDAYDGTTGKFTAPVDGTYLFTVHICVSSISLNIHIVVDDVPVTRSLIHADNSHYQCLTATDVLNLTTGDKVWIINNTDWGSPQTFLQNNYARAYFTGLLV